MSYNTLFVIILTILVTYFQPTATFWLKILHHSSWESSKYIKKLCRVAIIFVPRWRRILSRQLFEWISARITSQSITAKQTLSLHLRWLLNESGRCGSAPLVKEKWSLLVDCTGILLKRRRNTLKITAGQNLWKKTGIWKKQKRVMSAGQSYHSFNKLFISTAHAPYGLFSFRLCYALPLNRGHKRLLGHAVNQALSLLSPQNVKFAFRKNSLSCNKLRAFSRKSEFRVKLEWSLGTGDLGPSTVE